MRLVLTEEQGAGVWVWVTYSAPEPLLPGVLGAGNVHARSSPRALCASVSALETLVLGKPLILNNQQFRENVIRQTI